MKQSVNTDIDIDDCEKAEKEGLVGWRKENIDGED